MTNAAIDSTTGITRGTTQQSWRFPAGGSSVPSPASLSVGWARCKLGMGLNATLKYISSPLLIPP